MRLHEAELTRKPGGDRRNQLGAGASAEQHRANLRGPPARLRQGLLGRKQGHVLQRQLGVTSLLDAGFLADLRGAHARPAVGVVADEVCIGAGNLAFVDGDCLKPGKNLESLAYLHRRIGLDGLTQRQSVGPDHPIRTNPRSPIFVLLYPLDETEHILAARMECHHVIVVLQLRRFPFDVLVDGSQGYWLCRIMHCRINASSSGTGCRQSTTSSNV